MAESRISEKPYIRYYIRLKCIERLEEFYTYLETLDEEFFTNKEARLIQVRALINWLEGLEPQAFPGWVWNQLGADYEEGLGHLKRYVEDNDHASVPSVLEDTLLDETSWHKDPETGFPLEKWVGNRLIEFVRKVSFKDMHVFYRELGESSP